MNKKKTKMISLLCQKSNNGTITSTNNKNLYNFLILGEPVKEPIELIKKDSSLDNFFHPESTNFINSENNEMDSRTDSSDIRINKNVDFNDTKKLHSNRNNVHIVAKSKPPTFRSIKSSINNKSSPRTPPILVTSNDVPPISTSAVSMEKFNVENFHREQKKLNRKKLRNMQTLLDNQINKSVTHKQVYDQLNEFLDEDHEFIEKINFNIEKSEAADLRKRELIYKNWHLNVYEPIQREIQKNMNSTNDYARNIRNLKYLEYLQYINKYGYAFQEDFEAAEYDPTDVISICANIPIRLRDPTTIRQRLQHTEDRTLLKLITGMDFTDKQTDRIKLPLILNDNECRADLDWNSWILDHYNSIESKVRSRSGKKCQSARYNSEYNLNWEKEFSMNNFVRSNELNTEPLKKNSI